MEIMEISDGKRKLDEINGNNGAIELDEDLLDQLLSDAKRVREDSPEPSDDGVHSSGIELPFDDKFQLKLEHCVPKSQILQLETSGNENKNCVHEVVVPSRLDYVPLKEFDLDPTFTPAKTYAFELDPFQKEAILCIENKQSVLVSAHTSAGKTVVAEYAIALGVKANQRVIYTTPIKALSNQKFREFQDIFGVDSVGLITGDVTNNPKAQILIMTTEILRLMLFRGSEVMREVGWVIFDEIHYMRDPERGVVWEETIILLPDNVRYVFLSATIPNACQFAEWIAHLHSQVCHVVYTDYRPVPLRHYIYPAGGGGIHLVLDGKSAFREDNFNAAMTQLQKAGDSGRPNNRTGKKDDSHCLRVIRTIIEQNWSPVIVFSFSRRDCEQFAKAAFQLSFNNLQEKAAVDLVFENAISSLSEEDQQLTQVQNILPLLRNGVGIHHSGLLPIVKETIEILFGEGLIKVLFATETFAMGLNMPARTVVFTNARKFDGIEFRWINSSEYIQMSGRAGRRGLDDRGNVIQMIDERMSPTVGKEMISGKPAPLNSAFHLTYNMVLNLMRVEDVNPQYMLEHSFFQFQNYVQFPKLKDQYDELNKKSNEIKIDNEEGVRKYYELQNELERLRNEFTAYITHPKYIAKFLTLGRLVKMVTNENAELDWGCIVSYSKAVKKHDTLHSVLVCLPVDKDSDESSNLILPPTKPEKTEMRTIKFDLRNIAKISTLRIFCPTDLRHNDARKSVQKTIQETMKRTPVPLMDPVEHLKIKDQEFINVTLRMEKIEKQLAEFSEIDPKIAAAYDEKKNLEKQMETLKGQIMKTKSILQMDELKFRKRVLMKLGYSDAHDVLTEKGKAACEISSGDELLITELLFNGAFTNLSVPQICALLSCFVWEEKTQQNANLTDDLAKPLEVLKIVAKKIVVVSKDSNLEIDEQTYIEKFKPNLMDVVYAWAKGKSFHEICQMTDAFEGSIIRCLKRLEELIRQLVQAARAMGNTELEEKFSESIKVIKRDIVFASSLYL